MYNVGGASFRKFDQEFSLQKFHVNWAGLSITQACEEFGTLSLNSFPSPHLLPLIVLPFLYFQMIGIIQYVAFLTDFIHLKL